MVTQDKAPAAVGMAMDEFIRRFAKEGPFELLDGERKPVLPNVSGHVELLKLIYDFLRDYERANTIIRVFFEQTFVLTDNPNWIKGSRIPDIAIYATDRLAAYKAQTPDWRQKPFMIVPDLCIEVVSPTDEYVDVDDKVTRYLQDGVRLVWIVNPRQKSVIVWRREQDQSVSTKLAETDTLTGGEVMPNFSLPIRSLFSESE